MIATHQIIAGTDSRQGHDAPVEPASWFREEFGPAEKLVLSYFAIYVELMLIAALGFGYGGVIVMAVASAALALAGLVVVTATGLR